MPPIAFLGVLTAAGAIAEVSRLPRNMAGCYR